MAVRWPDGQVTGSVRRDIPAAPAETDPEPEQDKATVTSSKTKKEASDGAR